MQGDKPSILSLNDEFFGGEGNLEVRANVIFADEERDDIIGEYLTFCSILKEQLVLYNGDKETAIRATISICIEQGKLVRYLSEHRREVEDYMFALLSDEELKEAYGDYRHRQGVEEGIEQSKISDIKNLMKNLKLTAEQAMEALGIDKGEFSKYMSML